MPEADDLLFLLRIVSDPDGLVVVAEDDGKRDVPPRPSSPSSASWRGELASLPARRRELASSCGGLRDALRTWRNANNAATAGGRRSTSPPPARRAGGGGSRGGGGGGGVWGGEEERDDDDDDGDEGGGGGEGAISIALVGVEHAATVARASAVGYLESAEGCASALRRFWRHRRSDDGPAARARRRPHRSPRTASRAGDRDRGGGPETPPASEELGRAGRALASQWIDQISLDVGLSEAMVTFLDDELYHGLVDDADDEYDYATTTTTTTTMMFTTMMEKLRVWGVAASRATRIDISLWDFVAREVHDDDAAMDSRCEREEEEEESAGFECAMGGGAVCGIGAASEPFLNGERSTRILPLLVPIGDYGSGGTTIASYPRNAIASVAASTEGDDGDGGSTRGRILSSSSVEEAVETFARRRRRRRRRSGRRRTGEKRDATNDDDDGDASSNDGGSSSSAIMMTSILLVGDEGCGKTHAMDAIQRRYSSSSHHDGPTTAAIEILRPDRTVDMVGNTIGSTEDRLIALFAYALERAAAGGNCLVVLDDVDRMFSLSDDDDDDDDNVGSSYHVGGRCRALFVTILDALRKRRSCHRADEDGGHLLLLCTARSRCGEMADRFDRVFGMGRPDDEQRRRMILSCLSSARADDDGDVVVVGDASEDEDDVVGAMASLVARHSVGKSACELAQCCREVMLRCAEPTSSGRESNSDALERRLRCLDGVLQTKIPQSLRGGSLEGVVDVRVFTPEELRSRLTTDENGDVIMPLLGAEATRAYDALMNVVVTPLCRSDEIRALLYGGGSDDRGAVDAARPTRVGALLAGAPGVGKTSLAYHCAAVAAKMARVSLLDVSATSLIHKEIGGSERAVRSLFAAVRAAAPCVLLIDGIESVAPVRGNDTTTEGTMDRVLSTFLTEMDGIEDGGEGGSGCGGNVAVIGITHLPDAIDPALLRPGRLEKTITLGAPEYGARREIVARQIEDIDFDFASAGYFVDAKNKEEVSSFVANETAGMSAMEVIAICREASMVCLRELNFETTTKPSLTYNHFQRAMKIMKGKAGA